MAGNRKAQADIWRRLLEREASKVRGRLAKVESKIVEAEDATTDCRQCGQPVPCAPGKQPREFCDDCRRFRAYLRAAERHLERIDFRDPHKARVVRSDLIAVANKLPVRWQRPRDERGRFSGK